MTAHLLPRWLQAVEIPHPAHGDSAVGFLESNDTTTAHSGRSRVSTADTSPPPYLYGDVRHPDDK